MAHCALRSILGNLLGTTPAEVILESGVHRKPSLIRELNVNQWEFNMSRSGDRAIIAVTRRRRIGIDIELITQGYDDLREVATTFSTRELCKLDTMPREEAAQAFYRCWTRKEAFLKGIGIGILGQLNAFSVSVDPDKARLLHVEASLGQADDWTFAVLDDQTHIPPYAAALAVEGNGASITSHNYACP